MTNCFPFCCRRRSFSSPEETANSPSTTTVLQGGWEATDSPSTSTVLQDPRDTVLQLFAQMSQWMTTLNTNSVSVTYNWTQYHLSVLHSYVSKLSLNSDLKVLRFAKFKDIFGYYSPEFTIDSFAQEIQELLVVPKKHQLFKRDDELNQSELVAAFINLLLLLLCGGRRRRSGSSVEDIIGGFEKELRFLLTLLGDSSFVNEQALAAIEAIANEAGRLVHYVVFSPYEDLIFTTTDQSLGLLPQHMNLLEPNIINLPNPRSVIAKTSTTASVFIINSLLSDLENLLNREDDDMIADVMDQIKMLHQDLQFLQSFIKVSQLPEYKEPVMRIIEVAYEAEYWLNSFMVGAAPLSYFSVRFSYLLLKIKLIRTDIEEIKMNCGNTSASEVATKDSNARLSLRNKSGSEIEDVIVGFEKEAIDILGHLEGGGGDLQLISIFGMPGLGQTTLAKMLYNHPIVTNRFDRRSWCVVSQTYHVRNLLIDILVILESELDKNVIQNMEEEDLVVHIHKTLKRRRYLIVLDDIWASNAWYDLRRCFPNDRNGSRILFTSRNKDGAPSDGTIYYKLSAMSVENCLELLEKRVFINELCPPQLREIGINIAAKCGGLPLIVVVVAGILSSMGREASRWRIVEENLSTYIFSDRSSLMHILELSYIHLPDHLKACFLYFGSFREGMGIPVEKLKCLWTAEGFVHEEERKKVDDVAEEYLMELIDRSLVIVAQRRPDGRVKTCAIHDLLRDLCLKISEEVKFLKLVDNSYSIYEKHQRLCLGISDSDISLPFGLHVRSLFGSPGNSALNILNMKLLRVLDVMEAKGCKGNMDEIKLLIHLRYLAINYEPISMGSLNLISSSLVNLEFLILGESSASFRIPSSVIVKMMKLRYVKFPRNSYLDIDCDSSQTNNSLEFLYNVVIWKSIDEEMLRCSPHLRKLKCMWEVSQVVPDFSLFTQLEWLTLTCQQNRRIVDINLPLNITRLNLRTLGLPWEKISTIGRLPNLQILKLSFHAFVGETWETRDGEFQQLIFLKLEWSNLNHWNVPSSEHFPKLCQLVLSSCRFLQEIPYEIGEIATLQLIEVKHWCQKSLVESARQIELEQRDNGNEELRVVFTHTKDAETW